MQPGFSSVFVRLTCCFARRQHVGWLGVGGASAAARFEFWTRFSGDCVNALARATLQHSDGARHIVADHVGRRTTTPASARPQGALCSRAPQPVTCRIPLFFFLRLLVVYRRFCSISKTAAMFTMALAFIIFVGTSFALQGHSIADNVELATGADIVTSVSLSAIHAHDATSRLRATTLGRAGAEREVPGRSTRDGRVPRLGDGAAQSRFVSRRRCRSSRRLTRRDAARAPPPPLLFRSS